MDKNIIKIAKSKLRSLTKRYGGFRTIVLDNWRGWRFIFDTNDTRNCQNDCQNCGLYQLLKDEKEGLFSAGLYLASKEDKEIFGSQNFLNCKTLKQYQDCFINFILLKARSQKEIETELKLVRGCKIVFSKDTKNLLAEEESFREAVRRGILKAANQSKKEMIKRAIKRVFPICFLVGFWVL